MIDFSKRHARIARAILSLEQLNQTKKAAAPVAQPSGLRGLFRMEGLKTLAHKVRSAVTSGVVVGLTTVLAGGAVAAVAQQVTPQASTEACFTLFAATTVLLGAYNTFKSFFGQPASTQPKSAQDQAFHQARRATRSLANSVRYAYTPA